MMVANHRMMIIQMDRSDQLLKMSPSMPEACALIASSFHTIKERCYKTFSHEKRHPEVEERATSIMVLPFSHYLPTKRNLIYPKARILNGVNTYVG